jgi:hypothetical protein
MNRFSRMSSLRALRWIGGKSSLWRPEEIPSECEAVDEVSSWLPSSPHQTRLCVESEGSRLDVAGADLEEIASGPLGALLDRFSCLNPSKASDPQNNDDADHRMAEERRELLAERNELKRLDPTWFDEWQAFENSLASDEWPLD